MCCVMNKHNGRIFNERNVSQTVSGISKNYRGIRRNYKSKWWLASNQPLYESDVVSIRCASKQHDASQ